MLASRSRLSSSLRPRISGSVDRKVLAAIQGNQCGSDRSSSSAVKRHTVWGCRDQQRSSHIPCSIVGGGLKPFLEAVQGPHGASHTVAWSWRTIRGETLRIQQLCEIVRHSLMAESTTSLPGWCSDAPPWQKGILPVARRCDLFWSALRVPRAHQHHHVELWRRANFRAETDRALLVRLALHTFINVFLARQSRSCDK